jgi:tRNA uridine 5-carboxymethylaminomethyl modification enzyme
MTSRAEFRLLLRQDNSDIRLTKKGYNIGLISEERYQKFLKKQENINKEIERIKSINVRPTSEVNELLRKYNTTELSTGIKLSDLIKRTELNYELLKEIDTNRPQLTREEREEVNIEIKYEGYINLEKEQIENFKKLEQKEIPNDIDYSNVKGIRIEARQKLIKYKPTSIGQASRISGISPADISVLLIYLQMKKEKQK